MKRILLLAVAALSFLQAPARAEPRVYDAPTLEALAAPLALYPDPLFSQVLAAAAYPADVAAAAGRLGIDDPSWSPSVRALVPYPEILERMAESPQWMADLAWAAKSQGAQLMQAVQALRQRAYAAGYLKTDDQQIVQLYGHGIVIQPVVPQVVYLAHFNPYVVYGTWRPVHRIVQWRPWVARRVVLNPNGPPSPAARIQAAQPQIGTRGNGNPSPARQLQLEQQQQYEQRQQRRQQLNSVPQSRLDFSRQEKRHDHRDAGRRHAGRAAGNAPHARSKNPGNHRLAG